MVASMHTAAQQEVVQLVVRLRKAAGLSQRTLAGMLGREQSYLGRIETGQRRVDVVEPVQICLAGDADPNAGLGALVRAIAEAVPRRRRKWRSESKWPQRHPPTDQPRLRSGRCLL